MTEIKKYMVYYSHRDFVMYITESDKPPRKIVRRSVDLTSRMEALALACDLTDEVDDSEMVIFKVNNPLEIQ